MNKVLRSGEVATEANVNIETLRYYERRGLLDEPSRLPSGQRQYTSETVRRVRAIKRAQSLGFTLDEIESLLTLRQRTDGHQVNGAVVNAAREKLRQVEEKEAALKDIKACLQEVIAKGCDSLVDCTCGDCPLDGGPHSGGRDGGSSPDDENGLRELAQAGPKGSSIARSVKQIFPAGALAVIACSVCLLPGLVAGGLGVGVLGSQAEKLEVGPFALVAMTVVAAMLVVLVHSRLSGRTICSCHSTH